MDDASTQTSRRPEPGRAATPDGMLAEIAERQFAVFSRVQALQCGLTRHQITARLASGVWSVVHPKVYRIAAAPVTRSMAAIAGRLYAGERAWFSHATAARLHGIDPRIPADRPWLTVPVSVHRARRPGVVIVRSRRIEGFTDVVHNQPVLDRPRTVVDLAGVLRADQFRRMLYDVLNRNVLTAESVLGAAEDFGGKVGVALVHEALDEFDPKFESGLEREADELFRNAGLSFECQYEIWEDGILLARLDFADEEIRLGVELDGARFHTSMAARSYDRERDRMLRRRGWHIERLTTEDIVKRPQATLRHIVAIRDQRLNETRWAA